MDQLVGHVGNLAWVACKAALLFLTAVIAFRLAERRTVAEMGAFDFVAAVACGAIVGRVPNSSTTSYLQGAVTLVTLLILHSILTRLRFNKPLARLIDHPSRQLVTDGVVNESQLSRSGLTNDDLLALLRAHDVHSLDEVKIVLFEQRGTISVIKKRGGE
jgi:uncharacterized membrane protein YcaP (DUF421 family)